MPCENRHVLGWYRLIRELKESEVGVICVFDGAERGLAKQREVREGFFLYEVAHFTWHGQRERRRKVQRMEVARGAMEVERLRRLRRLAGLLKQYQALPVAQKDQSAKLLQRIIREPLHIKPTYESPPGAPCELDSDILQLSNDPILDARPLSAPKETSLIVSSPTVVMGLGSRALQTHTEDNTISRSAVLSPSEPTQVTHLLESQAQRTYTRLENAHLLRANH